MSTAKTECEKGDGWVHHWWPLDGEPNGPCCCGEFRCNINGPRLDFNQREFFWKNEPEETKE